MFRLKPTTLGAIFAIARLVLPPARANEPAASRRGASLPYSVPAEKRLSVIISSDAADEVDEQFAIAHAQDWRGPEIGRATRRAEDSSV